MKLNYCAKSISSAARRMANVLMSLVAIALMWHGAFFINTSAVAAPAPVLASVADNIEDAADSVRDGSKDLIRDTKRNVEKTANRNASKVDEADDDGTVVERKAQRDRSRIMQRAEEDAARTERAVDNNMNAVKGAVEKVKDAFN